MKKNLQLTSDITITESNLLMREMVTDKTTKTLLDMELAIIASSEFKDEHYLEYTVTYSEFCKLINPQNPWKKNIKEIIEESVKNIMSSTFWIYSEGKSKYYHFVENVVVDDNNKTVTLRASDDVIKFFINIEDTKTVYALKEILNLRTLFQAKTYTWLMSKCNFNNDIKIGLRESKAVFGDNPDMDTHDFIKKLNDAIVAINNKTNLRVSYEKEMEWKNIKYLKFTIENEYRLAHKERTDAQKRADAKKNRNMYYDLLEEKRKRKEAEEVISTIKEVVS